MSNDPWNAYFTSNTNEVTMNTAITEGTVRSSRPYFTICTDESQVQNRDQKLDNVHYIPTAPEAEYYSNLNDSSPIVAGSCGFQHQSHASKVLCRICYSSEKSGPDGEPLISPCLCKGTMGLYHRTCLSTWLRSSDRSQCEVCSFKFDIRKVRPSFCEYVRHVDAVIERKNLITDILCFLVLSPLVFISSSICVYGGLCMVFGTNLDLFYKSYRENASLGFALLFLSFVLLLAYANWFAITLIFHRKCFNCWQETHMDFNVVDQLSYEESAIVNDRQLMFDV